MKRLGMWNRLAIVAIVLTTLIVPTWVVLSERAKIVETSSNGYQMCMKAAANPDGDGTLNAKSCGDIWFPDDQWYPGLSEWGQGVGAVLLM